MIGYAEDEDEQTQKPKKGNDGTPVLDNFSRDLIKLAEEGKLDVSIGREKEVKRMAQILARRKKNNPIIIGDAGSGKTNLVEGLAILIQKGDCPKSLQGKRIVNLDLNSVVAGTKYRGQFEERMKVIIDELRGNPNIIIFIDEIHTLVGSGNSAGSMDGANIFKPALARGEIQCIGATTVEEYRKYIERDKALERRFQTVKLESATVAETIEILKNSKAKYEKYHKVKFSDEIIELCVKLADRYIPNRAFPDKGFDIMDEVGAKCQTDIKLPEHIEELKQKALDILLKKKELVRNQEYEKAAELRDSESKILKELELEKEKFEEKLNNEKKIVEVSDVYDVISLISNVPVNLLSVDDKKQLKSIGERIKKQVIGQDEAIDKITKSIRRARIGINDPNKPNAYVLLGNTGVGKTHVAKQLAKEIFGSEDSLIRIDMSEYQERHTLSRLVGSPPGYVDSDKGGELTEKVKQKPYSVILFDEIEKAHRDIYSIFLQILDDGHITDALGRKVNFKNTLILFTTNIGIRKLQDFGTGIGFNRTFEDKEEVKKDILVKEVKKLFAPEFLNRIDDVIVFNQLTKDNLREITKLELNKFSDRLKLKDYLVVFDESVYDFIVESEYDENFGARPLKRAIQNHIEDFISDKILDDEILEKTNYEIFIENKEVKISKKKNKLK